MQTAIANLSVPIGTQSAGNGRIHCSLSVAKDRAIESTDVIMLHNNSE